MGVPETPLALVKVHPRYGEFRRPWPLETFCFTAAEAIAGPKETAIPLRRHQLPFDAACSDDDFLPPVGEAADE